MEPRAKSPDSSQESGASSFSGAPMPMGMLWSWLRSRLALIRLMISLKGLASCCLQEWSEPDDATFDIDQSRGRRDMNRWGRT
jgi:hypothetical protein